MSLFALLVCLHRVLVHPLPCKLRSLVLFLWGRVRKLLRARHKPPSHTGAGPEHDLRGVVKRTTVCASAVPTDLELGAMARTSDEDARRGGSPTQPATHDIASQSYDAGDGSNAQVEPSRPHGVAPDDPHTEPSAPENETRADQVRGPRKLFFFQLPVHIWLAQRPGPGENVPCPGCSSDTLRTLNIYPICTDPVKYDRYDRTFMVYVDGPPIGTSCYWLKLSDFIIQRREVRLRK